jgi:ribulose-5-phosphate 4-epimerase/fuculose-1-phosphate aldolase
MAEEDCQNVSSTNFKISHASVTGGSAQTTVVYATSTASVPTPDPSIVGYPVSRYAVDRRQLDPVGTVRPEHLQSNPLGVSDEEWKTRTELAAAYRALYLLGLEGPATLGSDQAAQCLMHRNTSPRALDDNQNVTSFFMADWGVWFEEVTASNLLHFTVDGDEVLLDGTTRPGRPDRMNSGCVPVARAIFQARPDVRTIIHIHPHAVMAVGGLEWGLLPLSQAAFFLWGQVSREDYDFTYEQSFEETLQHGFDNGQRAMLLNHHGMYAVGRDVAEAVFVATHLTQACEVQVRTLSMVGGDLSKVLLPSSHDLSTQYKDMMDSTDYSYDGSREWPGIVRKVQRQAPDFNL